MKKETCQYCKNEGKTEEATYWVESQSSLEVLVPLCNTHTVEAAKHHRIAIKKIW